MVSYLLLTDPQGKLPIRPKTCVASKIQNPVFNRISRKKRRHS